MKFFLLRWRNTNIEEKTTTAHIRAMKWKIRRNCHFNRSNNKETKMEYVRLWYSYQIISGKEREKKGAFLLLVRNRLSLAGKSSIPRPFPKFPKEFKGNIRSGLRKNWLPRFVRKYLRLLRKEERESQQSIVQFLGHELNHKFGYN